MSETLPRVTVITPAFNRASLLEETILSVLEQDYPNLEYIVLDDGSEDGTLEVIKKFQNRLRWDSHANMGETRTVNKGFSMAEGDIIGVVSSDDLLLPGAISKAVQRLLQKPDVVVVYPDWQIIDAEGGVELAQDVVGREVAVLELFELRNDLFGDKAPHGVANHLVLLVPLDHRGLLGMRWPAS